MGADDEVDAVHNACLDELARAARPELLGVLEDEADLTAQLVAPLVQCVQRREQHRGVAVVAAGVHDAGVLGCKLEAGLLLDRERVDVGAQRERFPRPPGAHRRDEARLRRAVELDPLEATEQLEEERRRLVLLEAQLRVLMEMAPPRDRPCLEVRRHERSHGRSLLGRHRIFTRLSGKKCFTGATRSKEEACPTAPSSRPYTSPSRRRRCWSKPSSRSDA